MTCDVSSNLRQIRRTILVAIFWVRLGQHFSSSLIRPRLVFRLIAQTAHLHRKRPFRIAYQRTPSVSHPQVTRLRNGRPSRLALKTDEPCKGFRLV